MGTVGCVDWGGECSVSCQFVKKQTFACSMVNFTGGVVRVFRRKKCLSIIQKRIICNNERRYTTVGFQRCVGCHIDSSWENRSSVKINEQAQYRIRRTHYSSESGFHENEQFRDYSLTHPDCNVPTNIVNRIGKNLHLQKNHPLNTIKSIIENYWQKREPTLPFNSKDNLDPVVSTMDNFDSLLIKPDHVSRSKSDTYYLNNDTVLRTHTSAHQTTLMNSGHDRFLVTGDVYR